MIKNLHNTALVHIFVPIVPVALPIRTAFWSFFYNYMANKLPKTLAEQKTFHLFTVNSKDVARVAKKITYLYLHFLICRSALGMVAASFF